MEETKILSHYLSHLTYEDLDAKAVEETKKALLDWIGLSISGSTEEPPRILRDVLSGGDTRRESTLLFAEKKGMPAEKCGALHAAFLNGAASHSQDFDDLHNPSVIHLACVVIPPALALGEAREKSGKELIAAIAAGYELGGRVGEAVQPDSYYFWHTTGTVGCLAGAASSASILSLPEYGWIHALGSAGTQAAGLWDFVSQGAMSKPLHVGKACYAGVLSALLAEKGFTGSATILEGQKGFLRAMMKEPKWEKVTEHLGKDFKVAHNSIKPYPCCKHSHAAIFGTEKLMKEMNLSADDIKTISLYVNDITDSLINNPAPQTPYGCKFSIQYCVSSMAVRNRVGLADFREDSIHDRGVVRFMEKVKVVKDDEMTAMHNSHPDQLGSKIEIETADGQKRSLLVRYPKGDPEEPLSFEEVAKKGHQMTDGLIGAEKYEKIIRFVEHLEDVKNIREAMEEIF